MAEATIGRLHRIISIILASIGMVFHEAIIFDFTDIPSSVWVIRLSATRNLDVYP